MNIILAIVYVVLMIGVYLVILKRLKLLNDRHIESTGIDCLKDNCHFLLYIIFVLFLIFVSM